MTRLHHAYVAVCIACFASLAGAQSSTAPAKTQQEAMAERGYVRYRGGWRTAQEIELIERTERVQLARVEWKQKLERLRRQLDQPARAAQAAEEIAEIADAAAVPALAAAVAEERIVRTRSLFVQALARIRTSDATAVLVSVAIDHADPETRIAAVEQLASIGAESALPAFMAALASADNPRINHAAAAIGRLLAAVPPESPLRHDSALPGRLVAVLETEHMGLVGDGTAEGSTSATFTPSGGGLALGGGPKRVRMIVKNEDVLDTLATVAGVNFGWDLPAWRAWLASRDAPADLDLRRW
jgi:hypothetical protein